MELLDILRKELSPALGCTGPLGVCLAAANAYDAIGGEIKKIDAKIDWGIAAKIDDVAMPGTEFLGVEMGLALGALGGDPNAGLMVLHSVTPEAELKARELVHRVTLYPIWEKTDLGTYIDVSIETDRGVGRAIIAGRQDGLILKERNGEVLEQHEMESAQSGTSPMLKYKIADMYHFAVSCPVEELDIIKEAIRLNTTLADNAIEKQLGAKIGSTLFKPGADLITRAKAYAAAGCEGRMSGEEYPAMSCGGKGNVGVATTLPLVSMARDMDIDEEHLIRAITMSSLVAISIIHRIGKSPSMCSCEVAAALGIAAGTVVLQGGSEAAVETAMQNTIPNVFGVVCDGAKLACAMRIASGTSIAIEAANLALKGVRLANNQGVLAQTIDDSIHMLGQVALFGMVDSDRELSKIIFEKRKIIPLMTFADRQKQ